MGGVAAQTALGQTWSEEHKEAWATVFGLIGGVAQSVKTPGAQAGEMSPAVPGNASARVPATSTEE